MFRDLLVHVDASSAGRHRLDYALAMAARFNARVTGLHVRTPPDVAPVYKPSFVDQAVSERDAALCLAARASEQLFNDTTRGSTVPVRWRSQTGGMAAGVCEHARYADLVVVGQYEREGPTTRHPFSLADDVAREAGCPLIVTPTVVRAFRCDRAVVAWDGSPQSVRALHDALPLLAMAQDVSIVMVARQGAASDASVEGLTDHLVMHGLGERLRTSVVGGEHTGAILQQAGGGRIDLLVMGAFGNPAWLEWFLGGSTLDVLSRSTVPVFLSHA